MNKPKLSKMDNVPTFEDINTDKQEPKRDIVPDTDYIPL